MVAWVWYWKKSEVTVGKWVEVGNLSNYPRKELTDSGLESVGGGVGKMRKRDQKTVRCTYRYPSCRRSYLLKLLLDLVVLYETILPKYKSDNEILDNYPDLPVVYQKEQEGSLLTKLVHYNTVINRVHREQRIGGYYVSVEEDVLAALSLMEELVRLSKEWVPLDQDRYILSLLREHVGPGQGFTTGELYRQLGIEVKVWQRSLCRLHDGGQVKRVGGNRYRGYIYELVEE